jgi:hypothetical protein
VLALGLVHGCHHLLRLSDPDELEVGVRGPGGVEVDRPDLEDALQHTLVGVHVLHSLETGLLNVAGHDSLADVQAMVGDGVGGGDPLDQADQHQ